MSATLPPPRFFLTVDVEEWFASKFIATTPEERQQQTDFTAPLDSLLDLMKEFGVRGTFFCLFHSAQKYPEIIRRMIAEGHEIALHGDEHENILDLGPDAFRAMLRRTHTAFHDVFGVRPEGYRAPCFGMNPQGLEILAAEGFRYDSSVVPCLPIPGWYGNPGSPLTPHKLPSGLWELPISVHPTFRLPGGGGYYFRNLGYHWSRWVLTSALKRLRYAMFYLHPWELSDRNPKLPGVPFYTFRRTGRWAREHLRLLLETIRRIPGIETIPIRESLEPAS